MKNKKMMAVLASAGLVLCLGIGLTLAYFTDSQEQVNVITMGSVDIDLSEPIFSANNQNNTINNVQPNQEIAKDPTITLGTDSQNAYVRAIVTITDVDGKDPLTAIQKEELMNSIIAKSINGTKWNKSGDYFYYNTVLSTTDTTAVLFEKVFIPETWGSTGNDSIANKGFNIVVKAEAIQADNFTPKTDVDGKIIAWQYSDNTDITVNNYR